MEKIQSVERVESEIQTHSDTSHQECPLKRHNKRSLLTELPQRKNGENKIQYKKDKFGNLRRVISGIQFQSDL